MALKPSPHLAINSLFLQWLTEPETTSFLEKNLQLIVDREVVPDVQKTFSNFKSSSAILRMSIPSMPFRLKTKNKIKEEKTAAKSAQIKKPEISPSQKITKETRKPKDTPKDESTPKSTVETSPTMVISPFDSHIGDEKKEEILSTAIKPFYFPFGKPDTKKIEASGRILEQARDFFKSLEGEKLTIQNMDQFIKVLHMPFYWKVLLFNYLAEKETIVTWNRFEEAWKKLNETCHDESSKYVFLSTKGKRNFLEFDDFMPLVQDVVDCHPGLSFLQDAPEFHSRYIQTVISRIFYCLDRSWSSKIFVHEIRMSNLLKSISRLEEEEDINQMLDYFSYEHFYVIYCKFWELDQDHDLLISETDLARHNNHAISSRIIKRIFSGAVTKNLMEGKLTYRDFVWFLISEEDKKHPRSIEYWFRCMDLDGDGIISMYEMEYFYEEQLKKMKLLEIETLPFADCLCQMLDMINPKEQGKIRLSDLKNCALTNIFFDTFFNLEKYLRNEQRDPFSALHDEDAELSDFERFAAEEYEMLVAEEATGDYIPGEHGYEEGQEDGDLVAK